jgi:hypothetical protein
VVVPLPLVALLQAPRRRSSSEHARRPPRRGTAARGRVEQGKSVEKSMAEV